MVNNLFENREIKKIVFFIGLIISYTSAFCSEKEMNDYSNVTETTKNNNESKPKKDYSLQIEKMNQFFSSISMPELTSDEIEALSKGQPVARSIPNNEQQNIDRIKKDIPGVGVWKINMQKVDEINKKLSSRLNQEKQDDK